MNVLKKLFKDKPLPVILDPLIGKTVIHFTTHGCQATIHEFDYIGKIIDVVYKEDSMNTKRKLYVVEILKDTHGEKRDNNLKNTSASARIPSWYLQDLGGDFLIAYD